VFQDNCSLYIEVGFKGSPLSRGRDNQHARRVRPPESDSHAPSGEVSTIDPRYLALFQTGAAVSEIAPQIS